jgi:hypothetical protein
MPELSEINYSRDACVAAIRDYYHFLTKMYLKESDVIEPPEGGWPSITPDVLREMGKTEEVISLLRHLPYIRGDVADLAQGAPWSEFADWQCYCQYVSLGRISAKALKSLSEGGDFSDEVPATVIGLTSGGSNKPVFLLDTEHGIIHWPECPFEIRAYPTREKVKDDPEDYAPENEVEWRADSPAWAIGDFFETLKDQFRDLHYVPISELSVIDEYSVLLPGSDGMIAMLQDIYRKHGWPDIERYRKKECMEAVQKALKERYPDFSNPLAD